MKLPTIIKRDSASALEKAQQDLTATQTEIARLQAEYLEKILDEPVEAERIDQRVSDLHRQAKVFADRIAGLEQRLASEREEQDEKAYLAAVDKFAATGSRHRRAAEAVENALAGLADSVREFERATKAANAAIPDDPRAFGGLSTTQLATLIKEIFAPDRGLYGRHRPLDYLQLAKEASGRGFAEEAAEAHARLALDLRHAHDPRPVEDESEPENPGEEEEAA